MWNGMEGIGWGWMGLGIVHMALFWGLLVLAVAALLKGLDGGSRSAQSLLEILKARYARGEITGEQYEQLRRELQS